MPASKLKKVVVQFLNKAAVILEKPHSGDQSFFSQSAQVLLGTEIHLLYKSSVKQLPLYYPAFAFRVLLNDFTWFMVGRVFFDTPLFLLLLSQLEYRVRFMHHSGALL